MNVVYMEKEALTMLTKYKKKNYKEFPYKMCPKLKHKLDLLIKTLNKRDVWILLDGDEGSGKTNTAAYLLYYFHCATGREFTLDRFYFDSDDMFNWVKDNSNGLICWDEAALGGLSTEWASRSQVNLIKFAMTGRKKHHVFILNVPRFNKLKEDLRKDRIHALIHMDLGKKGDNYGHFIYLTRRGIRALNRAWEKNKMRPYAKCSRMGGFFSTINVPFVMNELIDEDAYEKKKDIAISQIGEKGKKENPYKDKLENFQSKIVQIMKEQNLDKDRLAATLGIHPRTLYKWSKGGDVDENASCPDV